MSSRRSRGSRGACGSSADQGLARVTQAVPCCWRVVIMSAVLAFMPVHGADTPADVTARATALVADLGLVESPSPARDDPRWRRPTRIVVRADFPGVVDALRPFAPGVELVPAADEAQAAAAVPGAQAIIGLCNADIVAAGTALHWVQLFSAGSENCVTIPAVRERQLLITNMQRISSPQIAEHAIAMLLAFTRGLNLYLPAQRSGQWNDNLIPRTQTWELTGRTLLVVGLGGIGSAVARRAQALGMRVVATRGSEQPRPDYVDIVATPADLLKLAAQADVVVNATPLTAQTTALFDAQFFAAMKPTAYFINVGRGRSVVTADLVEALRAQRLAGAGLDVLDPEPLPADHPLWQMPNVIITPHVAASSDQAFRRVLLLAQENLRRYVAGERLLSMVDPVRGY